MKNEIGHYIVNGNIFTNKLSAILEAQKTNADISWHFYDDVFEKVNWNIEPAMSLDALYMLRAKQIREAYDYVVVFCSGGADSNNVIRTFLNNNIRVDEVIAMAPVSGLKNWNWNDKDTSPYNTMSETKYAQFPLLDEISNKDANIKITILDNFDDMVGVQTDEWIYDTKIEYVSPVTKNHGKLDKLKHLNDLAENGKRIAAVWGIDKPVIGIDHSGNIYTIIADIGTTSRVQEPFALTYPNVDRVFFYWSHEMPELMVKQAHVVAREMLRPENVAIYNAVVATSKDRAAPEVDESVDNILARLIPFSSDKWRLPNIVKNSPRSIFQRSIVPMIYPSTYTRELFQCEKFDSKQSFFVEHQSWFYQLHGNTINKEMIASDFKLFYKSLSPKYINKWKTGFKIFSKSYMIGNKKDFLSVAFSK